MKSSFQTIAYRGGYIHLSVDERGKDEVRVQIAGRTVFAKSLRAAKRAIAQAEGRQG